MESSRTASALKFVLPSLAGILIFLTPIRYDGQETIFIGVLTKWLEALFEPVLLAAVVLPRLWNVRIRRPVHDGFYVSDSCRCLT